MSQQTNRYKLNGEYPVQKNPTSVRVGVQENEEGELLTYLPQETFERDGKGGLGESLSQKEKERIVRDKERNRLQSSVFKMKRYCCFTSRELGVNGGDLIYYWSGKRAIRFEVLLS